MKHHIRVIAPSDSYKPEKALAYARAEDRLKNCGVAVSYGKYIRHRKYLGTASAYERAADLHDAYGDETVTAVMALHGGFAENDMLPHIDWPLLRRNPKPFIGYSDNTILLNAILCMTGTPTLLGPNFGTLGSEHVWEYTFDEFMNALYKQSHTIPHAEKWFDHKNIHPSTNACILQPGTAEATLIGGNSATLYLLQGTPHQPLFDKPFILALENDDLVGKYTLHEFSRALQSILQLPATRSHLQGIIIGRFQTESAVTMKQLAQAISANAIPSVPVIANLDFGHTMPMTTLPIGGTIRITAETSASIEIVSY